MQSQTLLRLLMIGAVITGAPLGCGSGDSSILAKIGPVPARATQVVISSTLDTKSAMNMQTLMPPDDHFAVDLPSTVSGHLVLSAQALDSDNCLQAASTGAIDLPAGRMDLSMPLVAQTPRKCGNVTPCAANTLCSSPKIQAASIQSVWTISPTNIWAVGNSGTILHFDGNAWTQVPVPGLTGEIFYGVWASAANDVWVVGTTGHTLHYDGSAWTDVPNSFFATLFGIWGITSSNIWAVGSVASGVSQGTVLHYDGSLWRSVTDPGLGVGQLNSVWADNANFVYACGVNGLLTRYNGTSWTEVPSGTTANLHAIWGTPGGITSSVVFATGDSGAILRFRYGTDTGWLPLGSTGTVNGLYGINGDGAKVIYAVGSMGAVVRADAPSYDSFVAQTDSVSSTLFSVHIGSNGLAWSGGVNGFLGYLDSRP